VISGAHVVVYECVFHPSEQNGPRELYLMCNNIKEEIASLKTKGVECSEIQEQRWGLFHRFNCLAEASWGFTAPACPSRVSVSYASFGVTHTSFCALLSRIALEDNQGIAHRVIPTAVFTRESSEFHHVDPDLHDPAAHMGAVHQQAEQREWREGNSGLGAVHRSLNHRRN
jgi:hypothetical protein